jgi:hypothetical protein
MVFILSTPLRARGPLSRRPPWPRRKGEGNWEGNFKYLSDFILPEEDQFNEGDGSF